MAQNILRPSTIELCFSRQNSFRFLKYIFGMYKSASSNYLSVSKICTKFRTLFYLIYNCRCLVYFDQKSKAKIDLFLIFMLIYGRYTVQKLQFLQFFCSWKHEKTLSNLEKFQIFFSNTFFNVSYTLFIHIFAQYNHTSYLLQCTSQ